MIDDRKVIISLTTIPSRMEHLYPCLRSIIGIKGVDEIVLVLPMESKREPRPDGSDPYRVPKDIHELIIKHKITILRSKKDLGPATKLIPVLKREMDKKLPLEKENLIITLDDDKFYQSDTVTDLLKCWEKNKKCVCARKGGKIVFTAGKRRHPNYQQSIKFGFIYEEPCRGADFKRPSIIHVVYGTGGVLYRPSFFNDEIFDYEVKDAPKEAFFVDDVWISGHLAKRRITSLIAPSIRKPYHDKTANLRCGMMDLSTAANTVNRLFNINLQNDCHTNVITMKYFKVEFMKLQRYQRKHKLRIKY